MVYRISENETRSMTAFKMVIEKERAVSVKFLQSATIKDIELARYRQIVIIPLQNVRMRCQGQCSAGPYLTSFVIR